MNNDTAAGGCRPVIDQAKLERVAARLAGEVWGGRWVAVPADELVPAGEEELEGAA